MLLFLPLTVLLTFSSLAFEGEAETDALYRVLSADNADRMREIRQTTGYDFDNGVRVLVRNAWLSMDGILKNSLQTAARLLAVCLLCSAISLWCADKTSVSVAAVNFTAVGTVLALGAVSVQGALEQMRRLLEELSAVSGALLPSLTAAGVAAGNGGASVAQQGAALLMMNGVIVLFSNGFLPLVYAILAVRSAGILSQNAFLTRASAFVKNTVALAVRVILSLSLGYLTVSGLIGHAADTLAKRAAKTAISAGIPVVGGVLTDAAEAIYAAGALVKNTIGIFGLLAVLSCALLPLLSVGCSYLCLRASAALAMCLPDTGGREAVDALADAAGTVFALCAGATALLLLTVILCMR